MKQSPPVAHVADVPDPVRLRDVHPVEVAVVAFPVPAQAGEHPVGRKAHFLQDGAEEGVHLEAVAPPMPGDDLVEQVLGFQGDVLIVVHVDILKGDVGGVGPVKPDKPLRIRTALRIADAPEQCLQIHVFHSFSFFVLFFRISFPDLFVNPQGRPHSGIFSRFWGITQGKKG